MVMRIPLLSGYEDLRRKDDGIIEKSCARKRVRSEGDFARNRRHLPRLGIELASISPLFCGEPSMTSYDAAAGAVQDDWLSGLMVADEPKHTAPVAVQPPAVPAAIASPVVVADVVPPPVPVQTPP